MEKIFVLPGFEAIKFHNLNNYVIFLTGTEKFEPMDKEFKLPKKLLLSSQKYGSGIRDPRFEIRKKLIRDPGSRSRGQISTGSRIRIRSIV
jgi:hypothetical protein